jgi:nucleotide-binding universal stress UspA family protein
MSELIVVGIDGSAESAAALAYATTDAARRGARVRVVSVNQMPEYWAMPNAMAPPSVPTKRVDLVSVAQKVAQKAVDAFAADHPELARQVQMEIVTVTGHPATELVEQSREADLLVLGHRGRGAIASTFMGSVGLNCVLHAHCPVTVVRPTWAAEQVTAAAATVASSAV